MNNNKKSGFTLIELLVVVAIIGILASLVIASLNQARSRGVDAAIKGTVSSMRAQAEIIYDSQGNYEDLFGPNSSMMPLVSDVEDKNGEDLTANYDAGGQDWFFYTPLTTEGGEFEGFCADSSGFAGGADSGDLSNLCQ